ncbi:MAG: helix-turn-helix domain-containing protein [Clostridia bacterium]|nr:helix-turn-helix domain-containing protein [Clostridia bacterium]
MVSIGEKIRNLRKNKNVTQAQLADALAVSSQSVSKWENDLSAPDISVLPAIARYFGITMDELFNYRLDALNYKERFVRFMVDNGMLRFGEFQLKSGRVSPYLIHSGYYRTGSQISKLGEFYAECIREHAIEANRLVGNTNRVIPLIIATSMTLYGKYGFDTDYSIDYSLKSSQTTREMTLITDTFTSGATIRDMLEKVRTTAGKYPKEIVVCVDRMERSDHSSFSAKHEIEQCYGVRIHSIVTLDDIICSIENGVIAAGEYLELLKEYKETYRGL